ncbi:MAG: hypothetical protein JEZ09_12645, partial [Salinivirgaceae bacterium]|nr:hypothetical protein [Salinivirgaceae bacterium]
MRKFTFLLALLAFTTMTFAQQATIQKQESVKETIKSATPAASKDQGDVYWSEDFDGANWTSTVEAWGQGYKLIPTATLPTHADGGTWKFVDNLGLDYLWHWSDVGTRGAYSVGADDDCHTPDPATVAKLPEGTSTENGFMIFEGDYFNTTASCVITSDVKEHDTYMVYGPIDFSDKPGAIFNIKTYYRFCCDPESKFVLQFCDDFDMTAGTGTWGDEYRINSETPNNDYTYTYERDFSINVSADVIGKNNVYFKISIITISHYFAIIDDIKFIEPPVNDLLVTDNWAHYLIDTEEDDEMINTDAKYNFYGGYTQIPVTLASPFVKFKSAVTNNGLTDAVNAKATVEIYKNGVLDLTAIGDPITVNKYTKDTLKIVTDYTPSDIASYQVSMNVDMDAEDNDLSNNSWGYNFEAVSNVYSRVYHGHEDDFSSAGPRDWKDGGYDGDMIAQYYDVPEGTSVALKAISVYMHDYRGRDAEIAAIEAGSFAMIGRVFLRDLETGENVNTGIATEVYPVNISDTATWVTLDFVDEGNLNLTGVIHKQYFMAIETFTGTQQELRFEVGTELSLKQPNGNGGWVYLKSKEKWAITGDNYAIDMILNIPNEFVNVTFNVNMSTYTG